ncbi:hypothetical protein I4F81_003495 [Pyropia yezoensis]|uniref:Uncharacterized protein n=1 Tax=Pyropia yezoensis TaxID=2788 RepID=A0ACC3BSH7_PYRYE|nr:hypothetical protein I4F81_003495 [Neopyropia yezoensis]
MQRTTNTAQGMPGAEGPPPSDYVQPPSAAGPRLLPSASLEYGPNGLSFYPPGVSAGGAAVAAAREPALLGMRGLYYNRAGRSLLNADNLPTPAHPMAAWSASPLSTDTYGSTAAAAAASRAGSACALNGDVPPMPLPSYDGRPRGADGNAVLLNSDLHEEDAVAAGDRSLALPGGRSRARVGDSSHPHAQNWSSDASTMPVHRGRGRAPPMELNIRPMRNGGAPDSSTTHIATPPAFLTGQADASAAPSAAAPAVPPPASRCTGAERSLPARAASHATPQTGRRGRAGARSRSPSPKRRGTAGSAGVRSAGAQPGAPVTLDVVVRALAFGFKAVDNRLLRLQKSVDAASRTWSLSLSATDASAFLHSRVRFPSKSRSGRTIKTVSRYLKQTVSYFYTQIRQTAVKQFVDSLYKHSNHAMGKPYKAPNAKRARIILTKENALELLSTDGLLEEVAPWKACIDALVPVFNRVGAGDTFSETVTTAPVKRRPVYLLAHVALVMTKIVELLKRVRGEPEEQSPGMNAGHRILWQQLLIELDGKFRQVKEPQRGLRLRDVDPAARAIVENDNDDEGGLANFGGDEAEGDDADEEADGDASGADGQ